MNRIKGQSSTEYIILLATMLIILSIVAYTLISLPQSKDVYEDELSFNYWKNSDIAIASWSANETMLIIIAQNNMPQTIEITDININNANGYSGSIILESGRTTQFNITWLWNESLKGSNYQANIDFTYTDVETSATYYFYGTTPLKGTLSN